MLNILVFLSFFIQSSNQAYPLCPTGVTCPPGGLWTEWVASGNGYCQTSCGSCSKILQLRTCTSASFGCNCTGATTRQVPCNTQICGWPAQRTCCIPYISMKINGTSQCGPFVAPETSQACCKAGGYWSDWSGYSKSDDGSQWIRSRDCLSTQGGCPCIGDEIDTSKGATCPCARPEDLIDSSYFENGTTHAVPNRPFTVDDSDCTASQYFNRSYSSPYTYCKTINGTSVPQVRLKHTDNTVTTHTPGLCQIPYAWTTVRFTCDLYSLLWRYEPTDQLIVGLGQVAFL